MKPRTKNILFILAFILIMFLIMFSSVYIHEQGHIYSAKKQNISFEFGGIDWMPRIDDWGKGSAVPSSTEDCEKFNSLSLENKKKITYAGVKAEFLFILPLLFVSLFLLVKNYKKLFNRNRVILVLLILFNLLLLFILFFSLFGNVWTSNPAADWNFVNFSDCSIYSQ